MSKTTNSAMNSTKLNEKAASPFKNRFSKQNKIIHRSDNVILVSNHPNEQKLRKDHNDQLKKQGWHSALNQQYNPYGDIEQVYQAFSSVKDALEQPVKLSETQLRIRMYKHMPQLSTNKAERTLQILHEHDSELKQMRDRVQKKGKQKPSRLKTSNQNQENDQKEVKASGNEMLFTPSLKQLASTSDGSRALKQQVAQSNLRLKAVRHGMRIAQIAPPHQEAYFIPNKKKYLPPTRPGDKHQTPRPSPSPSPVQNKSFAQGATTTMRSLSLHPKQKPSNNLNSSLQMQPIRSDSLTPNSTTLFSQSFRMQQQQQALKSPHQRKIGQLISLQDGDLTTTKYTSMIQYKTQQKVTHPTNNASLDLGITFSSLDQQLNTQNKHNLLSPQSRSIHVNNNNMSEQRKKYTNLQSILQPLISTGRLTLKKQQKRSLLQTFQKTEQLNQSIKSPKSVITSSPKSQNLNNTGFLFPSLTSNQSGRKKYSSSVIINRNKKALDKSKKTNRVGQLKDKFLSQDMKRVLPTEWLPGEGQDDMKFSYAQTKEVSLIDNKPITAYINLTSLKDFLKKEKPKMLGSSIQAQKKEDFLINKSQINYHEQLLKLIEEYQQPMDRKKLRKNPFAMRMSFLFDQNLPSNLMSTGNNNTSVLSPSPSASPKNRQSMKQQEEQTQGLPVNPSQSALHVSQQAPGNQTPKNSQQLTHQPSSGGNIALTTDPSQSRLPQQHNSSSKVNLLVNQQIPTVLFSNQIFNTVAINAALTPVMDVDQMINILSSQTFGGGSFNLGNTMSSQHRNTMMMMSKDSGSGSGFIQNPNNMRIPGGDQTLTSDIGGPNTPSKSQSRLQKLIEQQEMKTLQKGGYYAGILRQIFNPVEEDHMKLDSVHQLKNLCKDYYHKKKQMRAQLVSTLDIMEKDRPKNLEIKKKFFKAGDYSKNIMLDVECMRILAQEEKINKYLLVAKRGALLYYRVLKRVVDEEIKLVPMVFFIADYLKRLVENGIRVEKIHINRAMDIIRPIDNSNQKYIPRFPNNHVAKKKRQLFGPKGMCNLLAENTKIYTIANNIKDKPEISFRSQCRDYMKKLSGDKTQTPRITRKKMSQIDLISKHELFQKNNNVSNDEEQKNFQSNEASIDEGQDFFDNRINQIEPHQSQAEISSLNNLLSKDLDIWLYKSIKEQQTINITPPLNTSKNNNNSVTTTTQREEPLQMRILLHRRLDVEKQIRNFYRLRQCIFCKLRNYFTRKQDYMSLVGKKYGNKWIERLSIQLPFELNRYLRQPYGNNKSKKSVVINQQQRARFKNNLGRQQERRDCLPELVKNDGDYVVANGDVRKNERNLVMEVQVTQTTMQNGQYRHREDGKKEEVSDDDKDEEEYDDDDDDEESEARFQDNSSQDFDSDQNERYRHVNKPRTGNKKVTEMGLEN